MSSVMARTFALGERVGWSDQLIRTSCVASDLLILVSLILHLPLSMCSRTTGLTAERFPSHGGATMLLKVLFMVRTLTWCCLSSC
ncbi:hypothetical protein BKA82DRAFT_1007966 [Pisolithus tinctorius]|uniref:Uncharacterized protein n=1 Tax=Pisolithus tinctorius Marx 270 TaxID=870435 RepID=A0A0C3NGV8_PISTI|nr:hypothetical protein BKA82DRAFT_1007966 [Pisolithus tinctorius]KIN94945.1 hypothetical protein M404DRAFT_1007966 [Pisolithus tinctorius Marx 270]